METGLMTPLRNLDNETERVCEVKETQVEAKTVEEDVEIIKENFTPKLKPPPVSQENKNIKIKKVKIKRARGEKRKLPDKTEPVKKVKRKRKDEKSLGIEQKIQFKEKKDAEVVICGNGSSTPQPEILSKNEDCEIIENDSDAENKDVQVKQKFSRKTKAIANSCRETLEVLVRLGSDILVPMDASLKILNSHNLLNSRYVSMETLMDLVALALETCKGSPEEKELNLSKIVTKRTDELCCSTPRTPKGRKSILPVLVSPKTKSVAQEDVPSFASEVMEVVEERETSRVEDAEEKIEECQADMGVNEKSQEPTVEKSGKNFCITNYFKKLKKTVDDKEKNERFSCFTTKTDMFLAPKLGGELTGERRRKFEEDFSSQKCLANYLIEPGKPVKRVSLVGKRGSLSGGNMENSKEKPAGDVEIVSSKEEAVDGNPKTAESGSVLRKRVALIRVDQPKMEPTQVVSRTRAKLLQFHENRRPPYWGTWRRKSDAVGPRKPLAKDKLLNYEIDSDDEWESEEEPGESLHGSDDEKEPEEDYEVDNEFFVPHGYLSDDENPEEEKGLSPKTKLNLLEEQFTCEQKQKTRKMTPFVFGSLWVFKSVPSEGSQYQDLQLERLQYVPWTATPIQIEEEDEKKGEGNADQGEPTSQQKKSRQKIFPEEEIPHLIKMIHGSPQNSDVLAKQFLLYWEGEKIQEGKRPGLTKICVLKKIKELAAWQPSQEKGKMCWHVPRETRKEFGAQVEPETPPKKPRKCFIWKFVKKADKGGGLGSPSPAPEPEVVILES